MVGSRDGRPHCPDYQSHAPAEGNERPPDGREQIKAAYLYRYTLLLLLGAPMVSSTNSSGYSVKALRSSFVASTQSTARGRITPPER